MIRTVKIHGVNRSLLLIGLLLTLSACGPEPAPILVQLDQQLAAMPAPKPPYYDGLVYKSTLFSDVMLDLYLPYDHDSKPGVRHPVYVHVHGGSWMFGNRKFVRMADTLVETLRQNGIAVISIDYRKMHQVGLGAVVDDALASLQWLVDNADRYRLDTRNVVLHGPSAGGHLVLMMGFTHQLPELDIKLIMDDYGPTDLFRLQDSELAERRNILTLIPDFRLRDLSPVTHVRPELPPVRIIHSRGDDLVPLEQSEVLLEALLNHGNQASLEVLELHGPYHGMKNATPEFKQQLTEKRIQTVLAALDIEADQSINNSGEVR